MPPTRHATPKGQLDRADRQTLPEHTPDGSELVRKLLLLGVVLVIG